MSFNQSKLYAAVADPANAALSSADLAAKCNVTTREGIDLAALGAYLSKTLNASGQALKLSLKAAVSNTALPAALTNALAAFLDYSDDLRHSTLDYADPTVGSQVDQTLAGCVQAGLMAAQQQSDITAMGLVYPCDGPVQASDVDATRATFSLDQQRASVGNWISQNAQTAQGMADSWRAAGSFPADWKTQIQTTAFDPTK